MLLKFKAAVVSTLLLVACGLSDLNMYVVYDTYSDAKKDEAIQRGWIPIWVPVTATNIHEAHNLDTNSRALSFTAPKANSILSTLDCQDTTQAPRPIKTTRLFPRNIQQNTTVKNCDGLWVFVGSSEDVHIWAN
jgi:hypothetical protein